MFLSEGHETIIRTSAVVVAELFHCARQGPLPRAMQNQDYVPLLA